MPKPLPPTPEDLAKLSGGDGYNFDYRQSGEPLVSDNGIQIPRAMPLVLMGARHIDADPVTLYGQGLDANIMAMPQMDLSHHIAADPIDLRQTASIDNPAMPVGGRMTVPEIALNGGSRQQQPAGRAPAPRPRSAVPSVPAQPQAPSDADSNVNPIDTPMMRAFMAQRSRDKADLAAAQGKADEARKWQEISNTFIRAGDAMEGRRSDEGALQQRLDNTQQPVRNVLQRQEVGRQSIADAQAQAGLSQTLYNQSYESAKNDLNSSVSKRSQAFLASTGVVSPQAAKYLTAADVEMGLKAGEAGLKSLALKAQIAHQNATLAVEQGKASESARHNKAEEDIALFKSRPPVQPAQQNDIEALINGAASIGDLENVNKNAGFFNRVGSMVGVGPAAETRKAVAPEVAKASAKGRVNPAGEVKEANSLPGPNTSGGADNLRTRRQNMIRDADAKLRVLEHDPRVEPNSLAQMRQQLNDVMQREGGSGAQPAGPTHYLVNKAKGIRIAADANGKPLPGAQPEPIQ